MGHELLDRVISVSNEVQRIAQTTYPVRIVTRIDGESMQACANAENKSIDITATLVEALKNDSELAFVVAHEVAHFVHKDHERTSEVIDKISNLAEKGIDEIEAEEGYGFIKKMASGLALLALGFAALKIATARESQKHETEADELALYYVQKAGYDPKMAIPALTKTHGGHLPDLDFWETLVNAFTGTHPPPEERADTIQRNLS